MTTAMRSKSGKTNPPPCPLPQGGDEIQLGIVPRGVLKEINIADIGDPPGQSDRMERPGDAEQIAEVARSLREVGQLAPVMVEEVIAGGHEKPYTRVFGRRRIAAARLNGSATILAIVVPGLKPDVRRTIVAVENIQRKDLSPAEEHLAVAELLELQAIEAAVAIGRPLHDLCGAWAGQVVTAEKAKELAEEPGYRRRTISQDLLLDHRVKARAAEMVAAMLAKSRTWVRERMYLGRLSEKARALVLAGKLPLMHAAAIARCADPEIRDDLAKSYAAGGDSSRSDLEAGDYADLLDEVGRTLFSLKQVPWRLGARVGERPPCDGCPHNSESSPGLFDGGASGPAIVSSEMIGGRGTGAQEVKADGMHAGGGICTLHSCYADKLRTAKAALAAAAKRIVDDKRDAKDPKTVAAFVDDKALAEKVAARKKLVGSGTKASGKKHQDRDAEAVSWELRQKLDDALQKRIEQAAQPLLDEMTTRPIVRLWSMVAREIGLFDKDGPELAAALTKLEKASDEGVVELVVDMAPKIKKDRGRPSMWQMRGGKFAEIFAKVFGVELGPRPTLADFKEKVDKPVKKK